MSSLVHILGEHRKTEIECSVDEPTIWIRSGDDTVSLSLTGKQREALRQSLDVADALTVEAAQ